LALLLLVCILTGCPPADEPVEERGALHFTDVTAESGIDMTVTSGRNPPTMLIEVKGTGLAILDFDNDGDPDVFVPNGATLDSPTKGPGCRLYENQGGMRFEDVTEGAGLTFDGWAYGCAVGDYDNDGFDDVYVACYGKNALLRNTGQGGFVDVSVEAGVEGDAWSSGPSFGDIDGDGDLDLYVANYVVLDAAGPRHQASFLGVQVLAGPMGLPPTPDMLYENRGDGTFEDVSESSGIRKAAPSWGLGSVILDFNGDHVNDIYVGNDSRASYLFRGLGGGKFVEVGAMSGIAYSEEGAPQATMGIAIGDVSGNGMPDVFTTNFMYDTNTLHVNLGDLIFEDRTSTYGLQIDGRPFLSWATCLYDFDHDADEDLVFFNGHIYPEDVCAANGWRYRQAPVLYERDGDRFRRLQPATAGAWLGDEHLDRSTSFGDLDGDGDVDMVVCGKSQPIRVLRNDRDGGDWLIVALKDTRPGHDHRGIGSKIAAKTASGTQTRWLASGVSFMAANQYIAHFGFAPGTTSVDVTVTWPDGHVQSVDAVPTGAAHTVERD